MSKIIKHNIELVNANKSDFIEFLGVYYEDGEPKKRFKLRYGIPFLLRSIEGHIENNNYLTSEETNLKDLGLWFKNKQIFTLKSRWI